MPPIRIGIAEKTEEPYFDSRAVRMDLLRYVENPEQQKKEIQDERVRKLAGQIEMLKNSQEVGVKYMRLWEELEEARREGVEEGHASGWIEGKEAERLKLIRKLMETMGWTEEQAMDALQIPAEEREKYRN